MNRRSLLSAIALAAGALVATTAPGEARFRSQDIVACILTSGADVDSSPDSLIWSCCVADGCLVCGNGWTDCTWEPAFRGVQWQQSVRPKTFGVIQGGAAAQGGTTAPADPRPIVRGGSWLGKGKLAPLQ